MKRFSLYILVFLTLTVASCQKELEPVLGDPDERLNEALRSYKDKLVSAEYGWNGYIYTKFGGGYSFHFVFHEDGRVEMVGDLTEETVTEVNESTWRLKSSQQSLLIFDTYSYLHLLADPNRNVFDGQPGQGYGSDYEFALLESVGNTLRFQGKLNKIDFYMVKATQQDKQDWQSGKVLDIATTIKRNRFASTLTDDLQFMVNTEQKVVVFAGQNGQFTTVPYTYNTQGISLKTPYSKGAYTFTDISWDEANETYFVQSKGQRVEMTVSSTPLFSLAPMVGYGKGFSTIEFNGEQINSALSLGLTDRWEQAKENNLLYMGPPTGRMLLDYAIMRFLANDEVSIHFRYRHPETGVEFTVGIWYRLQVNSNGTLQFTYLRRDNNTLFNDERVMKPFTADFFAAKTFRIDWVENPDPNSPHLIAGLYAVDDATDFFYGIPR
ncbi:DUF4302 domain-containing protein [Sphingobacterium sp. SGG-5]|uniref:DUF4302 domain-containing protein n=1 Tax=Sphingobacterium sp. SGG-5 TaxID=2710881 RepID=UPI0013EA91A6|nr:DUF4302 domain-containing protein [Sphingobacterium sp. SGG-5]NGM62176.1 DUF4302 domain-containing protein [Sphingobacterium sp. SGG-5]